MQRTIGTCAALVLALIVALPGSAAAFSAWPSGVSGLYQIRVSSYAEFSDNALKQGVLFMLPTPSMVDRAIREEVPATLYPFGAEGPGCRTFPDTYLPKMGSYDYGFTILCDDADDVIRAFAGHLIREKGGLPPPLLEYVRHKIEAEAPGMEDLNLIPYEIPLWGSLDKGTQQAFIQFYDARTGPMLSHWQGVIEIVFSRFFNPRR